MSAVFMALPLAALAGVFVFYALRPGLPSAESRVAAILIPASQLAIVAFLAAAVLFYSLPVPLAAAVACAGIACAAADLALVRVLRAAEGRKLARERTRIAAERLEAQRACRERTEREARAARDERRTLAETLRRMEWLLGAAQGEQALACSHAASDTLGGERRICGHPAVDALLALKRRACEEAGVRVVFAVELPTEAAIPDIDVCAACSNMLDNALQAARAAAGDMRFIEFRARLDGGYLVIDARNGCAAPPAAPDGGALQRERRASNEPAEGESDAIVPEHGWGLVILQDLAQRYRGSFEAGASKGVWRTTVALENRPVAR